MADSAPLPLDERRYTSETVIESITESTYALNIVLEISGYTRSIIASCTFI